jgi:hypothetical protein
LLKAGPCEELRGHHDSLPSPAEEFYLNHLSSHPSDTPSDYSPGLKLIITLA